MEIITRTSTENVLISLATLVAYICVFSIVLIPLGVVILLLIQIQRSLKAVIESNRAQLQVLQNESIHVKQTT